MLLAVLVTPAAIHTITIAAHPYLAILGLAERQYLVEDTTLRIIEFIGMIGDGKVAPGSSSGSQIDLHHALDATHQQFAIPRHQTADAATDVEAMRERFFQLPLLDVIEEQAIVGAYPHSVIDGIVGKSAHEGEQSLIPIAHQQALHLARFAERHHSHSAPPCAYPQVAMPIGGKGRYTVVRQARVGGCIMNEILGMRR